MVLGCMHWKPLHDSAALPDRPTGQGRGEKGVGCIQLPQLLPGVPHLKMHAQLQEDAFLPADSSILSVSEIHGVSCTC